VIVGRATGILVLLGGMLLAVGLSAAAAPPDYSRAINKSQTSMQSS